MKPLIIAFLCSFSSVVLADCTQVKEDIVIGCTYDCDSFYGFALRNNARRLGYKIKTVNLSRQDVALEAVDAILIPGGADINPELYYPAIPEELVTYTKKLLGLVNFSSEGKKRDPFEFEVVKSYFSNANLSSTPLLGICRGMQMMAVASGLPLYVDIKHELGIKNRYNKLDKIILDDKSSLLGQFYPRGRTYGVKYHHQGIRVDYYEENKEKFPDLKIAAFSHRKKIAESLEFVSRPALGIQYHPEKAVTLGNGRPVWKWFLSKACEKSNSR